MTNGNSYDEFSGIERFFLTVAGVLLIFAFGYWLTACCFDDNSTSDSGTTPPSMTCLDGTGSIVECYQNDPRCVLWECGGAGTTCCPRPFPFACDSGLAGAMTCAETEGACGLAGLSACPLGKIEPAACPIDCVDLRFPVACQVERPEGPVLVCAESIATCEGVPGIIICNSDSA